MSEYKIVITRIEEKPTVRREWKCIADTGNKEDGGKKYDYATYPDTMAVSTTVLEQTLPE